MSQLSQKKASQDLGCEIRLEKAKTFSRKVKFWSKEVVKTLGDFLVPQFQNPADFGFFFFNKYRCLFTETIRA